MQEIVFKYLIFMLTCTALTAIILIIMSVVIKLLLFLVLPVADAAGEICESEYGCVVTGDNLLATVEAASSAACHILCLGQPGCVFYTYFLSSSTCLLLTSCEETDISCPDCASGPAFCESQCPPLGDTYGGTWTCFPSPADLLLPADKGTVCVFSCGNTTTQAVECGHGVWGPGQPGDEVCHICPPLFEQP